jgi:subtilisin family serine protease
MRMGTGTSRVGVFAAVAALATAFVPGAASAGDYVLMASKWGSAQSAAVAAAGGSVTFAHGKAGIGGVRSDNPAFLEQVMASGAFQQGSPDVAVQWQQPTPEVQAVSIGSDETFFNAQWNLEAIEAPAAWNAGCTGDGVRVAVLDGGIHSTHLDLDGNLDTACSVSFVPGQAWNADTGTFWHGTHVAGIIAAENNNLGTIGVAPDATLMGVKVLHSGTGSFGWVIAGILYAADPAAMGMPNCARADIINMSLGAVFPKNAGGGGPLVAAMNKAVNYAASNGVLVVTAAGNDSIDFGQAGNYTTVPADSGSGVAVSSTGPLGFGLGATDFRRPASYSNYGEGLVHVAAPGGDFMLPGSAVCVLPRIPAGTVVQFCWALDMVMSTVRGTTNGNYSWSAGTSMAAPAAAGVAALILGADPNLPLGALKSRLAQTADDEGPVGHDEFYGHGFVNARAACEASN